MSEGGLEKGKPWFDQLRAELDQILFGVFCVTPENRQSQWMLWEAGFLSSASSLGDRRVAPLNIGISKGGDSGPLGIYQATEPTREDMLRLIKNINSALDDKVKVAEKALETTFGYIWPELERKLNEAIAMTANLPKAPRASTEERLDEVVALLRDGQRQSAETKAMLARVEASLQTPLVPFGLGGGQPGVFYTGAANAAGGGLMFGSGVNAAGQVWSPENPTMVSGAVPATTQIRPPPGSIQAVGQKPSVIQTGSNKAKKDK